MCVCLSVCLCHIEKDSCKSVRANGETDLFSAKSELTSECEMERERGKKRREAEEQISCWTAEIAFRFLRFYFCTLYI